MDEHAFWQLIDDVDSRSGGKMPRKRDLLRERLAEISVEDVLAFVNCFDDRMDEAYSWDLWGAAYLIGGGCGDDEFMDFRSTLISCGRELFESSLRDPDSLADSPLNWDVFFEGFEYVGLQVYEARAGRIPVRTGAHPQEPSGQNWDDVDLPKRFPRLFARFEWQGIDRR